MSMPERDDLTSKNVNMTAGDPNEIVPDTAGIAGTDGGNQRAFIKGAKVRLDLEIF